MDSSGTLHESGQKERPLHSTAALAVARAQFDEDHATRKARSGPRPIPDFRNAGSSKQ